MPEAKNEERGLITKEEHEGAICGDGHVLCFDCGGGHATLAEFTE